MHLSDDEIQDFLDGNIPEREAEIRRHCSECSRCCRELKVYRLIYGQLPTLPEEELSPGFSERVLTGLGYGKRSNGRAAVWDRLAVIAAAIGCIVASIILHVWSGFGTLISSVTDGARALLPNDTSLASATLDSGLIIGAALTLLVLLAADALLRRTWRGSTANSS